jgi:flagellar assembly protein FliH
LEPIDVDAFFINDEFSENETGRADSPNPDETKAGTDEDDVAGDSDKAQFSGQESIDISRIADFAEQLKAFIGGEQEQAGAAEVVEERVKSPQPEDIADFREVMEKAQREAEQVFAGAKNQAEELTQSARTEAEKLSQSARSQAEELTKTAKYQAEELAYSAKTQAESILEGAQSKFHELTEGAKQQAGSILEGAKREAGDITHSAGRQAEQVLDEAKQNAELITESANRKAAEMLEKAGQQSGETIKNAEQKAAEFFEATQRQAEEMIIRAKEQAVEIENQAKQEGYEAGHDEGLTKAQQEYEKKLADALTIVAQSEEARLTRIQSSEPELLKLAVAIAEKIIGEELKTDASTQVAIVRHALAGIPTAGTLTIKVNPEDYRFIEENLAEFQKVFSEPIPVKIQRDQGIAMNNCYIETDHGNIDARIKAQLDMIMAEILKMGRSECS